MARIAPLDPATALLPLSLSSTASNKNWAWCPICCAPSPKAQRLLNSYLNLSGALSQGALSARERELIALRVSELNACNYCVAAHTAIAGSVVFPPKPSWMPVTGSSSGREEVLLDLAEAIVEQKGHIPDEQLAEAKRWDIGDSEVLEIVAHVAFNTLTNFANHVAETDIDFPAVPELAAS